ncbi:MAG: CoA-transferase [Deltaproteobacteria bacterium]|nr:CoA-transferase [Deltaproteobacteria bacterium]
MQTTNQQEEYAPEELLISRMAKEMKGEMVGGAATYCSMVAVKLAQSLYNPDLIDMSGGLHHFDSRTPMAFLAAESLGRGSAKARVTWEELFGMVFRQKFIVWVGPAQIDQYGNANISVIGDWNNPKAALIGARGLPDDSVHLKAMNYHVVDHSKRSFPARVDFVCAVGFGEAREKAGVRDGCPGVVVSNLGVFDFDEASGKMRLQSLHPGVSIEEVKEKTGFELLIPSKIPETEPPTKEEVDLIRKQIDPLGLRFLDRMPRANMKDYLCQLIQRESELFK